jgi:type II secretory pathway component PulL
MTDETIEAWRCEECRRWISRHSGQHWVIVEDYETDEVVMGTMHEKSRRYLRVLVVCGRCREQVGVDPWAD